MSSSRVSFRFARLFSRRRLRPLLLIAVAGLIITEIVVLSPSSLEEGGTKSNAVDPDTLVDDEEITLATGIPKGRIAEYSVDQFQYVSTQGTEKQWKLVADKAYLYNKEHIVHSRKVHAYLYDPDGKITVVQGREAKYFMNQRDLEIFGDVHAVFPDGFELISDYLRYRPGDRKVEIPVQYFVRGDGHEKGDQNIKFESHGMDFAMGRSQIVLPQSVRLTFEKSPGPRPSGKPVAKQDPNEGPTVIESDRAVIHRDKQIAYFTMSSGRPVEKRFVHITQPTLFTRSRRAELSYGNFDKVLNYLVAFEDVLIKERAPSGRDERAPVGRDERGPTAKIAPPEEQSSLRYATGGRADFDARSDIIRLTEFPQAYQDNDTITGDIIIFHRDSDLVEVEHSNAFSQGN